MFFLRQSTYPHEVLFSGSSDTGADEAVQQAADTIDSAFSGGFVHFLIILAVVSAVTFTIIKVLQRFGASKFSGNMKIFYRIIYIAIIVIAALIVVNSIEPLQRFTTAIITGSGIAAVVIGLAAQQALGNLLSGISISGNKPFLVGERVEILSSSTPVAGIVKEIGLRHTVITDDTNLDVVIPNGVLDKEILRTFHSLDEEGIVNYLTVCISCNSDLDQAIDILRELADNHSSSLDLRTPAQRERAETQTKIHIMDLCNSTVTLRASIWTANAGDGFNALSDLRYAVKKAYDKAGIIIPCSTRNIIVSGEPAEAPVAEPETPPPL